MPNPASSPSPSNSIPAYTPNDPGNAPSLTNPDGSQIEEIVAKSGIAQRGAPKVRDGGGRFVPGSGRKP